MINLIPEPNHSRSYNNGCHNHGDADNNHDNNHGNYDRHGHDGRHDRHDRHYCDAALGQSDVVPLHKPTLLIMKMIRLVESV